MLYILPHLLPDNSQADILRLTFWHIPQFLARGGRWYCLPPYLQEVSSMPAHPLEEILHPKSIAVVGASDNRVSAGYRFTTHQLAYGYKGKIYPVNPKYPQVGGLKGYPSLKDIPGSVDYVISCVPAAEVLDLLEECGQKGVKVVHFFTARFSETGRQDAADLEQELLKRARKWGIRILGPNCMGLYYPREGIAFGYDFPKEPGSVGLAAQTGGGSALFIYAAQLRGVRFSKVISYGNAIDLNECDYLEYFAQDPETRIILMYIEGVKDGKRFFGTLRRAASTKPVIIVKAGRGESGTRAIASHTASLTSSMKVWETLVSQAGAISVRNFDEMADLAVSFSFLPPIYGPRVGIAGGGGGPSVLAADECEEAGLDVVPIPAEFREELKRKGIPIWDWIDNPTDVSILGGSGFTIPDMLEMMAKSEYFDLLVTLIFDVPFRQEKEMTESLMEQIRAYTRVKKETSKPILVVVEEKSSGLEEHDRWRWQLLGGVRTKLIEAGIPIYPTFGRAAGAARKLIDYYQKRRG